MVGFGPENVRGMTALHISVVSDLIFSVGFGRGWVSPGRCVAALGIIEPAVKKPCGSSQPPRGIDMIARKGPESIGGRPERGLGDCLMAYRGSVPRGTRARKSPLPVVLAAG